MLESMMKLLICSTAVLGCILLALAMFDTSSTSTTIASSSLVRIQQQFPTSSGIGARRELLGQASTEHSQKMALYSFYASMWAMLEPSSTAWSVAWDALFDGAPELAFPGLGLDVLPTLSEGDRNSQAGEQRMHENMKGVMHSWNSQYEAKNMTWASAMADDLPALRVVGAIWADSSKQNASSLTIVTTCNLARLEQLRSQCQAWPGTISVAIHQHVLQEEAGNLTESSREKLKDMLLKVARLVAEMQQTPSACSLRIMLAAEVYTDQKATILFPVNSLRNLARLQADTPLLALLDVDLLPSASLYQRMSNETQAQALIDQMKDTVWVIPGFEVHQRYEHSPWADALVSAGKELIAAAYRDNVVVQFHIDRFKAGHGPTNYTHWMQATEDYPVEYMDGYEPWLIGSRLDMPWHDERFRGFGKNKIQHILHLRLLGYEFKVLHNEYAVHRPHDLSSVAKEFNTKFSRKTGQKNELKLHMYGLLDKQEDAGYSFKAVMARATHHSIQQLAWWQIPKESLQQPVANRMTQSLMKPGAATVKHGRSKNSNRSKKAKKARKARKARKSMVMV